MKLPRKFSQFHIYRDVIDSDDVIVTYDVADDVMLVGKFLLFVVKQDTRRNFEAIRKREVIWRYRWGIPRLFPFGSCYLIEQ